MDALGGIACVGWGSLVWNPRALPIRGVWHEDGPILPVEFARQSAGGPMTLVICPGTVPVRTLWCLLDVNDMKSARQQLGTREYEKAAETTGWIEQNIGYIDMQSGARSGLAADAVAHWATVQGLSGAVWTSLPCGFAGKAQRGAMPSADAVLAYLRGLSDEPSEKAEAYIRNAPVQIDTPYRRIIARELGWSAYRGHV